MSSSDKEEVAQKKDVNDPLRVQKQLRNIFFFLFIIGLIGAFKQIWEVPAAVVIAYFLIGMVVIRKLKNVEGFADSLYYMGFLFTLWSLFIAFAPFGTIQEQIQSQQVMESFSIALITTVLGITGRIFILQSHQTVVDQGEEARESLSWLVKKLTEEMETSIQVLQDARNEVINAATESNTLAHEALNQSTEAAVKQINDSLEQHLTAVDSAVSDIADRMSNIDLPRDIIKKRYDGLADQMESSLARVTAATNNVVTQFESIKQPVKLVEQRLQETGAVIDESLTAAGKSTRELASRMKEVSISQKLILAPITDATTKLVDSIDKWTTTVNQLNSTIPSAPLVALLMRSKLWTKETTRKISKKSDR